MLRTNFATIEVRYLRLTPRLMAELAAEGELKGSSPWGDDPVAASHNAAQLLFFAAGDCARALVRELSVPDITPVYAHVVGETRSYARFLRPNFLDEFAESCEIEDA